MPTSKDPSAPSVPTKKRLFSLSGNRCAFPDCPNRLVDRESGSIVGEVCHIKGEKPKAARYDPSQDDRARHGFKNLILMCGVHHKVIDDMEAQYPVERLLAMKQAQEARLEGKEVVDDGMAKKFVAAVTNISVEHGSVIHAPGTSGGQVAHTINNYNHPTPSQDSGESLMFDKEVCFFDQERLGQTPRTVGTLVGIKVCIMGALISTYTNNKVLTELRLVLKRGGEDVSVQKIKKPDEPWPIPRVVVKPLDPEPMKFESSSGIDAATVPTVLTADSIYLRFKIVGSPQLPDVLVMGDLPYHPHFVSFKNYVMTELARSTDPPTEKVCNSETAIPITGKTIHRVLERQTARLHWVTTRLHFGNCDPEAGHLIIWGQFVNGHTEPTVIVEPMLIFRRGDQQLGSPQSLVRDGGPHRYASFSLQVGENPEIQMMVAHRHGSSADDEEWRTQLLQCDEVLIEGREAATNEVIRFPVVRKGEDRLTRLLDMHGFNRS